MLDVSREHIEIVAGVGGPKPRIKGSRIRVQDIAIWHEKLGMSPDEIVQDYPQLTLADVHATLAYYWDHRDEIERRLVEEDAFVEQQMRQLYPSPLKKKLERLHGDRGPKVPQGKAKRPYPRSLGIGASGQTDTARRTAEERAEPRPWR